MINEGKSQGHNIYNTIAKANIRHDGAPDFLLFKQKRVKKMG